MFSQISLTQKIALFTAMIILLPMTLIVFMYSQMSRNSETEDAVSRLETVCQYKKLRMEDYFENLSVRARILATELSPDALRQNTGESISFPRFAPLTIQRLRSFLNIYREDGIILFYPHEKQAYILEQESGEFRSSDTFLPIPAEVCTALKDDNVRFSDMAPDSLGGKPKAYAVTAFGDNSGGFLALPVSLQEINAIMQERSGMGETGDAYLVGQDRLLRSDSLLDSQEMTVQSSFAHRRALDTPAVREVLAGKSGSLMYKDQNGKRVLAFYLPVKIANLNWGLIAEADMGEMLVKQKRLQHVFLIMGMMMVLITVTMGFLFARIISRQVEAGLSEMEQLPKKEQIARFEELMQKAAAEQQFEKAAYFRDKIRRLKGQAII